ncbi:MAG: hypothetical protein KAZ87_07530 [Spirochaetes bacterium]|nr:hypothetical protein [Spirochaetota bacterium]
MIKTVFFDLGNTILDCHSGNLTDEEKDIIGLWRMQSKLKKGRIYKDEGGSERTALGCILSSF